MKLTTDQINDIAPDPASVKAGNKIFTKTAWSVFKSDRATWAEIQGSGSKPYYTQIDIGELAFKCTCPSRKFPCKHGLGLGLYIAQHSLDNITVLEEPQWVKEWIEKRATKKNAPAKVEKPVDLEKIKARTDDKWEKASKDVDQIALWLNDLLNQGILELPNAKPSYWQALMARMVDVKMPGINTFFRLLAEINFNKNWEREVLSILGQLHLLVVTVKNHQKLSADFKSELAQLLGWNSTKKELLQDPNTLVIDDEWIVIKVFKDKTEGLLSQKTYLYGSTSKKWAYLLDFAFGGYIEDSYLDGEFIKAKLAFYPGILQQRAIIKLKGPKPTNVVFPEVTHHFNDVNKEFIDQTLVFPWLFEMPFSVTNTNLIKQNNSFFLLDKEEQILPLLDFNNKMYLGLLAETQGHYFDAYLIKSETGVTLMSISYNNKHLVING